MQEFACFFFFYLEERRGDARGHLLADHGDHGRARPEDVAARGVRVALRRVQEEIREVAAPDVLVLGRDVAEVELVL